MVYPNVQIEREGTGRQVASFHKWWPAFYPKGGVNALGLGIKEGFRVHLPNKVPQPHKVLRVLSRIYLLHTSSRKKSCAFVFCACAFFLSCLWKWVVRVGHLHEGSWSDTESVSSGSSGDAPSHTVNALACCKQLIKQRCVLSVAFVKWNGVSDY